MKNIKIVQTARTIHFARIRTLGPNHQLLYTKRSYDFEEALARQVDSQRLSVWQIAWKIWREHPDRIELCEPGYLRTWPSLLLYVLVIRLRDLLSGTHTRIGSYALENGDIFAFLAAYAKIPYGLSKWICQVLGGLLFRNYDRIVFGYSMAEETYQALFGPFPAHMEHCVIPSLPQPCKICTPVEKNCEVLFLGAFEARKGVVHLMRAWPLCTQRVASARLLMVGKGPLLGTVTDWCADNPEVTLCVDPPRSKIHECLNRARVLVLLSQPTSTWREQLALPTIEALAHGCEIVTSTELGLAGWLRDHGHRVLSPDATDAALAEAICDALDHARPAAEITSVLPREDSVVAAERWLWQD